MALMKLNEYFHKLQILFSAKWYFTKPLKTEYLIYDNEDLYPSSEKRTKNFFKRENYSILHTRRESYYLFFLFKALINFKLSGIYFDYLRLMIEYIQPKYLVTCIGNDVRFYQLKKYFPSIKFISIGTANSISIDDFCSSEKQIKLLKKQKLKVDYYFVFDQLHKDLFSKFIKGKYIINGSFFNNLVKITKDKNKNRILYISQWRSNNGSPEKISGMEKLNCNADEYNNLYRSVEKDLISRTADYCEKNKIFMDIKLASFEEVKDIKNEILYFEEILKNRIKSWKFIYRTENYEDYSVLDKYNLIVTVDSTLGLECIMRGKKVIFYWCRSSAMGLSPKEWLTTLPKLLNVKYKKNGFIIDTHLLTKKEFENFMSFNYKISQTKWNSLNYDIIKKLKFYNYDNKIIKKILNMRK